MVSGPSGADADDAATHVRRCLEVAGLDWQPAEVERLEGGHGSTAWRFSAHGRRFVLRMPVRRRTREQVASQLTAHALCASAGVRVPPLVAAQPEGNPLGQPFLVLGWIDGCDLAALTRDPDSRGALARHARRAGEALAALHAVAGPSFDHFLLGDGAGRSLAWPDVCRGRLDELLGDGALRAALGERRLRTAARMAADLVRRLPDRITPGLTHGDCHFPNLVVEPDGAIALIDLEHARFYDPLWDFVKLDAWSLRTHPELVGALLGGYVAAGGQDPRDVERFGLYQLLEYLHALRYFVGRYPDEGMRALFLTLLDRRLEGRTGLLGAQFGEPHAGR